MPKPAYIKRTILLSQRHIDIVDRLATLHDREFSAQLRVMIAETEKPPQPRAEEPTATR